MRQVRVILPPDGKQIVFDRIRDNSDIVLIDLLRKRNELLVRLSTRQRQRFELHFDYLTGATRKRKSLDIVKRI